MSQIIEGVHPTRMELLGIKKRIKLAEKGHRLLKEKRDAIILRFFEIVSSARDARSGLVKTMGDAYPNLVRAEALSGLSNVGEAAAASPEMPPIRITMENIMGVQIPKVNFEERERLRSYDQVMTSPKLDEAYDDFNQSLRQITSLVEKEETVRRLSSEIRKTKRRVNALEYILLPRLGNTKKYIEMRLQEMERENFFRLKTVKKKKKQAIL
ncbi:MAG: V-type ATP synthase subunit D [Candidatus Altiarchaeota archaeon]